MNIKIGEKIKNLRKKSDVTQERFAEYLGITPQAISRWENGSAYPDIEIIPAIANFFNISTDELFGVDKDKNQAKIDKIHEKLSENAAKGLFNKNEEILRTALQEFPNNYGLLGQLSWALSIMADNAKDNEQKKKLQEESIAISERIISDCPDMGTKYAALQSLAYEYNRAGNKEKAIETANKLPHDSCSSNSILSRILEGEERFKMLKCNITNGTDNLYMEYEMLARSKYKGQPDKQIILFEKAIALFDVLCENKDYGFYNNRLCSLYNCICNSYIETKDYKNALDSLSKAANHAIAFDSPEAFANNVHFEHTSIVFEREPSDNNVSGNSTSTNNNSSREMLQDLKHEKYDAIRDDVKFQDIIANLEKYAKVYE